MKKYLYILFSISILSSCQDYIAEPDSTVVQTPTSSPYTISVDSALAYLNDFMADENQSRGEERRVVSDIIPIKYNMVASRAEADSIDCENLLYVANFENYAGYAILAADSRISDKIIAVIDQGHFSNASVLSYVQRATASDRLILDWYPTDGDGFFTTPETGNELFINPNTVNLYIEEEQDTLVGDFLIDDEDDFEGSVHQFGGPHVFSNVEYMTTTFCVSYATNEIRKSKGTNNTTIDGDAIGGDEEIGGEGHVVPTTRTEMIVSDWEVETPLLLHNYRRWHQRSPFNDLYPKRRKYLFFGHRRNALAGCGPLALAKLMTYFEKPSDLAYEGWQINWSELNNWSETKNNFDTATGELSATYLLEIISHGCRCWYFYNGTFTFPSKLTSFMRKTCFPNAHSHYYSFERVKSMIDNDKPLIIYAMPNLNVFKSHIWNIDGYKIKHRSIITCTYYGDELIETDNRTETYRFVHCDFGWRGHCNGYYVSGVFKLDDYRAVLDDNSDYGKSINYDTFVRVVTY